MDPVTIGAVIAAVAGGAGGALGAQVWAEISALVRRPFRHHQAAVPDGTAELTALEQAPGDQRRAVAVAEVLMARAGADAGFGEALAAWWQQASQVHIAGDVTNTVSGGALYGPVLQGRDFTGLTFATPPARPAPPAPAAPPAPPAPDPDA
jgi:hypothetical protein